MKELLSPRELAQAVGVSESSLKRWADEGLVHVLRTAGGHRRIPIAEAVRFIRERRLPVVRPDVLRLPDVTSGNGGVTADETDARRLLAYLAAGQAVAARGFMMSLYLSGRTVAEIFDGPLREALQRVGKLWKHDEDGILREHVATDICVQAINALRLALPRSDEGPVALGGAPLGDPYLIPSLAAATALAAEGFNAINLGPNTPFETLGTAVRQLKPRLVWLSISHVREREAIAQGVAALATAFEPLGVELVIGGSQRDEVALPSQPHVYVGATLGELVAFAKGLVTGQARDRAGAKAP